MDGWILILRTMKEVEMKEILKKKARGNSKDPYPDIQKTNW